MNPFDKLRHERDEAIARAEKAESDFHAQSDWLKEWKRVAENLKALIDKANNVGWGDAFTLQIERIQKERDEAKSSAEKAEAACAEMREVLNWVHMGSACGAPNTAKQDCPICKVLKSTDCGSGYVPRSELVEAQDQLQRAKSELAESKEWSEYLAKNVCEMEDALGFKNDCTGPKGEFVPTMGPWKERVRDLIAKEGELGDAKSECERLREVLTQADEALNEVCAYGSCDCDLENGDLPCVFCQCETAHKATQAALGKEPREQ